MIIFFIDDGNEEGWFIQNNKEIIDGMTISSHLYQHLQPILLSNETNCHIYNSITTESHVTISMINKVLFLMLNIYMQIMEIIIIISDSLIVNAQIKQLLYMFLAYRLKLN